MGISFYAMKWVWVNTYSYIFRGMNIHLPAICGFTRYQGFDPSPNILSPRTSISSFSSYIPMPCFFFHPLASSQWSPEAWESWLIYGESSPFMAARFQVSDILSFTQILYDYNMHIYIYTYCTHMYNPTPISTWISIFAHIYIYIYIHYKVHVCPSSAWSRLLIPEETVKRIREWVALAS